MSSDQDVFEINNKIALVTGGSSGIGLAFARALLKHGIRGLTIVDKDTSNKDRVVSELESKFGQGKILFVEADVSIYEKLEDAFKSSVEKFGNLDILINNAGIVDEKNWENCIRVNVVGVINGIVLGLDKYIPKHRSGSKGVIVNISSISGLIQSPMVPVYGGTKHAVVGLTKSFGDQLHYEQTHVKVLAICPAFTTTPMVKSSANKLLGKRYGDILAKLMPTFYLQSPEFVADSLIETIKKGKSGSLWIVKNDSACVQHIPPDPADILL